MEPVPEIPGRLRLMSQPGSLPSSLCSDVERQKVFFSPTRGLTSQNLAQGVFAFESDRRGVQYCPPRYGFRRFLVRSADQQ